MKSLGYFVLHFIWFLFRPLHSSVRNFQINKVCHLELKFRFKFKISIKAFGIYIPNCGIYNFSYNWFYTNILKIKKIGILE